MCQVLFLFLGLGFFFFWSSIIFILQIMAYASILLLDLAELLGEKGLVTKGLSDDL